MIMTENLTKNTNCFIPRLFPPKIFLSCLQFQFSVLWSESLIYLQNKPKLD